MDVAVLRADSSGPAVAQLRVAAGRGTPLDSGEATAATHAIEQCPVVAVDVGESTCEAGTCDCARDRLGTVGRVHGQPGERFDSGQ